MINLNQKAKENTRRAREWLNEQRISYDIELRGARPCFVLKHNGKSRRVTFSGSPSAYAGDKVWRQVVNEMRLLGYEERYLKKSTIKLNGRAREISDALTELAAQHRVHISFHQSGTHPYALLQVGDKERKLHFAGSPSDHRAAANQVSYAKRLFAEMGWLKPEPVEATAPKKEEKEMTKMAVTGPGSMFDAQQPSQGPASPVTQYGGLSVFGVPMIPVPKCALNREAGKKGGGFGSEYRKFALARDAWAKRVLDAKPAQMSIEDAYAEMVAAFALVGYTVTSGALSQGIRMMLKRKGEFASRRAPIPPVAFDPAGLLVALRDPPTIPEFARRSYAFGEYPQEFKNWAVEHRTPWLMKVFGLGGTKEQAVEVLSKAGHPAAEWAVKKVWMDFRKLKLKQAEAEKEKEARANRKAVENIVVKNNKPDNVVLPKAVALTGNAADTLQIAIKALVDEQVAKAMGGLDIEALKKKAARWDAYQAMKEAKARFASLDDE